MGFQRLDRGAAFLSRRGTGVNLPLMEGSTLRDYFTDAIKFWEPRRVIYNLVLAAIVIMYFAAGYPSSKAVLSIDFLLGLFLLAVAANIAYCAAYLVDVFVQASGFREVWQSSRWVLFAIGTTFAAIITRFIAMGMFHPVQQ
jgi:hypothetical protein